MIEIHDITNSIFTSKTYILSRQGENKAWLVDIGDVEPVVAYCVGNNLSVEGVFLTHGHFDHIYGLPDIVNHYPNCKVYTTEYGKQSLASEKLNMSKYFGTPIRYTNDKLVVVKDGDKLALFKGEPEMCFYETPGHNPGCLTMVLGDTIFTGDAYIPGIGVNTIPPHSNKEQVKTSLEKIVKLAKDKTILSGHEIERSQN